MAEKDLSRGDRSLRFVSSGTKIWNQLMMFVVVGVFPLLFPSLIRVENRLVVFGIVALALLTSIAYEVWRTFSEKKGRSTKHIVNLQLLTSVVLLTFFLHFFGRINGPFFVLYLLTVMESFLNRNLFLSNIVVGTMIFTTTSEFIWLIFIREIAFGFIPLVELVVRILSIVFMRAYGNVLAQKITAEERAREKIQETAQKLEETSQDLKKANIQLKEFSDLKDEFVSVASHELRGPMTTIKGYLSMILEGDVGKLPPKMKEFLKDAFESNDRMIRLVNNMLNISRIESGRLVIHLADIQLEPVIERVLKEHSLEAKKHGLELKYERSKKDLPRVRVDPDRIQEVLSNLVRNAINFTAKGQVLVKNQVEGGMVITKVKDTGVGISKENQKKLFEKFSQIDGEQRAFKKGSGLGLYICKVLINEFGGKLWVESDLGKGSVFSFSLPAVNR